MSSGHDLQLWQLITRGRGGMPSRLFLSFLPINGSSLSTKALLPRSWKRWAYHMSEGNFQYALWLIELHQLYFRKDLSCGGYVYAYSMSSWLCLQLWTFDKSTKRLQNWSCLYQRSHERSVDDWTELLVLVGHSLKCPLQWNAIQTQ